MHSLLLPFLFLVPGQVNAKDNKALLQPPVRVMSFNIRFGTAADGENHWDKRRDFLIETIQSFDPDLLGTQETLAFQRDFLTERLRDFTSFSAGRDDSKERGEMAALYFRTSRFEKLDGGHFWLSDAPDQVGSKGWDAALPRIATWVKLKDQSTPAASPIFFLNTHFDHRGQKARLESARLIRNKVNELGRSCRVIVTGDFNAAEASAPYSALFATNENSVQLLDAFRQRFADKQPSEGSFSGFKADQIKGPRIDWIACSPDWNVRLAAIDQTSRDGRTPSDHFPVTAVLQNKSAPSILRVLSYNIHHGEGTDGKVDLVRIAKVIRDADPDFVALQEVDNKTRRTKGVDQTAELARLTGMHARFGKAIDYEGGEYGQAVLSRFPIEKTMVHTLPGEPDREQRIAFEMVCTINSEKLSFITTHLHHANQPFRERQAAKLNELFADRDRRYIVAGDLNATPESKAIETIKANWAIVGDNKKLLSFPSIKPTKLIDYILFRPVDRFRTVDSIVIDEPIASDHRPVLAVIEYLPRQ